MKIAARRPHVALTLLAASVLGSGWGYDRLAASEHADPTEGPSVSTAAARPAPSGAIVDPAAVAGPPPVDLQTDPHWARDPFASVRETPTLEPPAAAAVAPAVEPVVRTILFSAERSVALVDGRIVKVGDRVGDGIVAEIRRDAVVMETSTGERKRLSLRPPPARARQE